MYEVRVEVETGRVSVKFDPECVTVESIADRLKAKGYPCRRLEAASTPAPSGGP